MSFPITCRWLISALLLSACGAGAPPPASPRPAAAPPAAAGSVVRHFAITTREDDGATRTTRLAITVPASWNARLDAQTGAPAFETAPNQTVIVLDVHRYLTPPAGALDAAVGSVTTFLAPTSARRTDLPGGRARVVFEPQVGPQVTALFVPVGASAVANCMIELSRGELDRRAALDAICDTLQILSSEVTRPAAPPAQARPPVVITPKRRAPPAP